MFFFGVGEDSLNGLGTKRVGRLAYRRMPDVLSLFEIVLPDMPGDRLDTLPVLCSLFPNRPVPADIALALVFPVSIAVSCIVFQHPVLRAKYTIIVFVVDILIPR